MWNLFKFPTKKETIDSWAKMLEDFTKVSILAIPVIFFGKESIQFKGISIAVLLFIAYYALISAKALRENVTRLTIKEEDV
ncbi:hypothetical protein EXH44_10775 [Actinobacillus indolicus]|uniref:Uncharacterized protein n=1 Tax=Actinobacillus indolicus TaxID=51049 RepID=A0A4P7CM97_9PAST|nr:hypothetical protein [Actinobacillus indolicus]QBQ64669.1 hypothetical protein EXH44_10775 [Actinobacillus indolicus]